MSRDDQPQLRALIYTRVSQDRTQRGRSVSEQEEECRRACADNGWRVVEVLCDNDRGASRWSTKDRPAYAELVRRLAAGDADVVVMWENSRGQRDLGEFAAFRDLCWTRGVLWSYGGQTYDLNRTSDRRAAGMDALDAESEASKTRDRILRSTSARARKGEPHGKLPYGYRRRYDQVTRELLAQERDPETAPVMRELVERALTGESLRSIANSLNERGVESPTDHRRRRMGVIGPARKGWTPEHIKRLLVSPTQAGLRTHNGKVVGPATWPANIEPAERDQLLATLTHPSRKSWTDNTAKHLLVGIARCGVCGSSVRLIKNRTYLAYVCGEKFCVARKQAWVDQWVSDVIVERLSRPDVRDLFTRDDPAAGAALDEVRALRARWTTMVELLKAGKVSPMAFAEAEPALLEQIEDAERRSRPATLPPVVLDMAGDQARERWDAMSVSQRRKVVRTLVAVTVHRAKSSAPRFDPETVTIAWRH